MARVYPVEGAPLSSFALEAKRKIDKAVKLLFSTGSLSVVGNGNAAARFPNEEKFVIGGFEGPLKGGPAAVVVLDFDETVHEGKLFYHHEEVLPLYAAILTERPDANVAVHTHSPHLVAWALAQRPLPIASFENLAHLAIEHIPVTEAAARYDAKPVIDTLRAHPNAPALLHANHGLLAWGKDFETVASLIVALEEAAKIVLESESIAAPAANSRPSIAA